MTPRSRAVLFVAACCVATFALKLWANAARTTAGHGDTAYYFHVAQNLFAGRGFVCDYVWSFLENPTGQIPAPSHAWWMPGPSIVAWLGMAAAGEASYGAAKVAMALLTSLTPAVVWWTARTVGGDRALAARATAFSVAFHPLIDQPSAPLSHGPYGLIVGAALALLAAAPLTLARGAVLGALIALGHYFRGDALTLFGTAGVVAIAELRRRGLRAALGPLAAVAGVYLIVMAPWFARNIEVFGKPMPPGPSKAVYLRDYYDWFALPDRLTKEALLAPGLSSVLGDKVQQVGEAVHSCYASYYDPTIPELPESQYDLSIGASVASLLRWTFDERAPAPPRAPPPWYALRSLSILMAPLTFVGIARLAARAFRRRNEADAKLRWIPIFGLHAAAEITFYAVLFTGVANQSYVSSLYSLYPLFCVGLAASLEVPGPWRARSPRASEAVAWAATLLLLVGNGLGVGAYLRWYKGPEYSRLMERFRSLGDQIVAKGFDPKKDRLMIVNTWNLFAAKPMPIVRIPDEPLDRIVRQAIRLGVTWLVIGDKPQELGPQVRPYRLQIYDVLEHRDRFPFVFRHAELRLNVVRLSPRVVDDVLKGKSAIGESAPRNPATKPGGTGSKPG